MLDMINNSFLSSCYFSLELKCLKYGNTQKPILCKNSLSVWAEECSMPRRRDIFTIFQSTTCFVNHKKLYIWKLFFVKQRKIKSLEVVLQLLLFWIIDHYTFLGNCPPTPP